MRKKLLFCSALLLSASLAGCGYNDDNIHETLTALPDTCTVTEDCVAGTISGQCVQGKCLRLCEDKGNCAEGFICESGLCREIIDCPKIENLVANETQPKKCLKVFSHKPATTWSGVLAGDYQQKKVSGENPTQDFTSENYTFQLPHQALAGGLNYGLVMTVALTFIRLEIEAASQLMSCLMPEQLREYLAGVTDSDDEVTKNTKLEPVNAQYSLDIDPKMPKLSLSYESLETVCNEKMDKSVETWKSDYKKVLGQYGASGYYEALEKRNVEKKDQTTGGNKQVEVACPEAYITWQTLQSVYSVIKKMTLTYSDTTKTDKMINWVLALLEHKKISEEEIATGNGIEIALPELDLNDINVDNVSNLHSNICRTTMLGIMENTLVPVLSASNIDLVKCMTHESLVSNLIENGLSIVQTYQHDKINPNLMDLISTLEQILVSGSSQLKAVFADIYAMLARIADPTLIWLTENSFQELDIVVNNKNRYSFDKNKMILKVNYKLKSKDLVKGNIDIEMYKDDDVNYTPFATLVEKTNQKGETVKTQPTGQTTLQQDNNVANFIILSTVLSDKNTHRFYVSPKMSTQVGQNTGAGMICGGMVVDVQNIEGYVEITETDKNTYNGTALIEKKQ